MRFYSHFGVQPEEVGLGYAQLLAQAAVAYLALFILFVVAASAVWSFVRALQTAIPAMLRVVARLAAKLNASNATTNRLARWSHDNKVGVAVLAWSAGYVVGAFLFVAAGSFWKQSRELAANVEAGRAIGGSFDITSWHSVFRLFNNPLSLRADRVTASETGTDLKSRDSLLYLGQADGTAVFYDSATKATLRVPVSGLVICRPFKNDACATPSSVGANGSLHKLLSRRVPRGAGVHYRMVQLTIVAGPLAVRLAKMDSMQRKTELLQQAMGLGKSLASTGEQQWETERLSEADEVAFLRASVPAGSR